MRKRFQDIEQWHRWFAWHSVQISGTNERVWLEWIERRATFVSEVGVTWEYRNCST